MDSSTAQETIAFADKLTREARAFHHEMAEIQKLMDRHPDAARFLKETGAEITALQVAIEKLPGADPRAVLQHIRKLERQFQLI